ncbi:aa3-type cytochrome c oxidase subunit IV [Sandaracinobacteroides sp. A072]
MSELNKVARDNRNVYEGFLTATKWGVILITILLILMAIFLA